MKKWNNPEITELNISETAKTIDSAFVCTEDCKFRFNTPPGQCGKCKTYLDWKNTHIETDVDFDDDTNLGS